MNDVFVYWDNSNIFHEAQRLADEREGTPGARYLVRVHFDNLLRLAHADRPLRRAVAAGSIPPEMRHLWNRIENRGVEVNLFDRGTRDQSEQGVRARDHLPRTVAPRLRVRPAPRPGAPGPSASPDGARGRERKRSRQPAARMTRRAPAVLRR